MRRDEWASGFRVGVLTGVVFVVLMAIMASCTTALVPRSTTNPCAPQGTVWSDSLDKCVEVPQPHLREPDATLGLRKDLR